RRGLRAAHGPDSRGRVTAGSAARDTAVAPSRFAAVIEQPEVRTELGRLSSTEWGWGALREIQLRALKWHRQRCTFELVMETTQGRHTPRRLRHGGHVRDSATPRVLPRLARAGGREGAGAVGQGDDSPR